MIELRQLKMPITHTDEDLKRAIQKKLNIQNGFEYEIYKCSIDSRKKSELKYVYTVLVRVQAEEKVLKRNQKNPNVLRHERVTYQMPKQGNCPMVHRPIVVGAGPAGLFCSLFLARAGYAPILIERGGDVDARTADIEAFWKTGVLKPDSNVQFGEGGAGTFSDGKLNTLVKDKYGRNTLVLETFVEFGAPKEILIQSKPHIGTDLLRTVICNMRKEIIRLGGDVRFYTTLTGFEVSANGTLTGIEVKNPDGTKENLDTEVLVLALGHSARDTFLMLHEKQVHMIPKAFAVGLRIEHDRDMIQRSQYGDSKEAFALPTASYKVTYQAEDGRGVFSFCMCPGGFVVNASSEEGMLAVNGMSNHARDEHNSNSAIIVTITPEDFDGDGPLAGMEFQRKWERATYLEGNGKVPVQRFADLVNKTVTKEFGLVKPNIKGQYAAGDLNNCLPAYIIHDIIEGIFAFDKQIHGFASEDAVLAGIESRTSSPIRIVRDDSFQCNIPGIYPAGEGAGYAGGITSAAMDGIKVYEAIASKYAGWKEDKA